MRVYLTVTFALAFAVPLTAADQPNVLSAQELADGWILLWDGASTFGWEPTPQTEWKVSEGALSASASMIWLRHKTPFADFVLKTEFRMANAEADSGIFIRAARDGDPTKTGYQININNLNEEYGNGSLVFRHRSDSGKVAAKVWHSFEITADGDHITVVLDGRKTLDVHDNQCRVGYIGFQILKAGELEFRNIKLMPLGTRPLFNGADLTGWDKVDRASVPAPPEWTVREGCIHVEKGPGQLETQSVYGDFVLQLEARANAPDEAHHPNSGVFFRGDKGKFWSGYESQVRNEFKDGDRAQPVDFGTGGLYNFQAARKVLASDGQFFHKTIIAHGRHVGIWVEGVQVTSFDDSRPEGTDARTQARLNAGTISLQAHDPTTNLDFRALRIVEFPAK
jgi:hypothetical protein